MIKLNLLKKSFDENIILKDLNLTINSHEILHITGKSGVGKTTLLRILSGIDKDFKGDLFNDFKTQSFTFPERVFIGGVSILKEIMIITNKDRNEVLNAFNELGLSKDFDKKASELSTGMRSRLSIIRSLLFDSEIIFLDEPLLGLDLETKSIVKNFINENLHDRALVYTGEDIVNFKKENILNLWLIFLKFLDIFMWNIYNKFVSWV